jgi:hypothetical protein
MASISWAVVCPRRVESIRGNQLLMWEQVSVWEVNSRGQYPTWDSRPFLTPGTGGGSSSWGCWGGQMAEREGGSC